jgi:hypothetical protein
VQQQNQDMLAAQQQIKQQQQQQAQQQQQQLAASGQHSLKLINLASSSLKDEDLFKALQANAASDSTALTIDLSNNKISNLGARVLAEFLARKSKFTALQTIDIRGTGIDAFGKRMIEAARPSVTVKSDIAQANQSTDSSSPASSTNPTPTSTPTPTPAPFIPVTPTATVEKPRPLCTIGTVYPNSPASRAGLCEGDKILRVGSVDSNKFTNITDNILPELRRSKDKEINIVFERSGVEARVGCTPCVWEEGKGLLGCVLHPVS